MIERGRLTEILETYGASQSRWPEAERDAAEAALARDAALRTVAAREQLLDDWLCDWAVPTPRVAAMDALLAASRVTVQTPGLQDDGQPSWVRPMPRRERWLSSGGALGLAAGIVALLVLAGEPSQKATVEVTDTSMIALAFSADQSEGWL